MHPFFKALLHKDKEELHHIIFDHDTVRSRQYDIVLMILIVSSSFIAIIDSIPLLPARLHLTLYLLEWIFTILFTIEYVIRVLVCRKPIRYIISFWGLIDLMAILPTYLSLFIWGTNYLLVIRLLRLMRVFRILRLFQFNAEGIALVNALKASVPKITIFMMAVSTLTVMLGTIMYVIEGGTNGFTSIPQSIYWAIVTITTVGYGDVSPVTPLGKFVASIAMLTGYAIIAIPTGIVSVEMTRAAKLISCQNCGARIEPTANYCSHCGTAVEN